MTQVTDSQLFVANMGVPHALLAARLRLVLQPLWHKVGVLIAPRIKEIREALRTQGAAFDSNQVAQESA